MFGKRIETANNTITTTARATWWTRDPSGDGLIHARAANFEFWIATVCISLSHCKERKFLSQIQLCYPPMPQPLATTKALNQTMPRKIRASRSSFNIYGSIHALGGKQRKCEPNPQRHCKRSGLTKFSCQHSSCKLERVHSRTARWYGKMFLGFSDTRYTTYRYI